LPVETNIIIFGVNPPYTPVTFVAKLKEHNILGYAISPTQVRLVLHLDITPLMVQQTIEVIESL
jgi:threonine aldolase